MPGKNCSIYGCSVSRRAKYKGVSIFTVPTGDDDFSKNWRKKLIAIIARDRVIDKNMTNFYICQQHFRPDQYSIHDYRKTLNPGVLPTLNLPIKSISTPVAKPRNSEMIAIKRQNNISNFSSPDPTVSSC